MGVQRHEFPELPIDNPPCRTVRILALNPKDGRVTIERVQTVTDPDPKSVQKNWYTTVSFLVPFEPEFEHERCEATGNEFIGDIHAMWGDGTGTSCL